MLTASEPFNDEMEVDFKKLSNWLDHYGLPQYHVHVSGHIMPLQLKTVLKEIDAAEIFPIRTENAELAGNFMRDLRGKVTLVEKGKEYRI
jgi:ribonuclease J